MKFNADEGKMINLGGNCANFTHAVSNAKLILPSKSETLIYILP